MDLKKFKFPNLTEAQAAFPVITTDKQLLEEAEKRDFYNGHTPYNLAFSKLFFSGGKVSFKEGLDEDFKSAAWAYCRAFMRSWAPKHEEKEAICAMLMSELIEPEIVTA